MFGRCVLFWLLVHVPVGCVSSMVLRNGMASGDDCKGELEFVKLERQLCKKNILTGDNFIGINVAEYYKNGKSVKPDIGQERSHFLCQKYLKETITGGIDDENNLAILRDHCDCGGSGDHESVGDRITTCESMCEGDVEDASYAQNVEGLQKLAVVAKFNAFEFEKWNTLIPIMAGHEHSAAGTALKNFYSAEYRKFKDIGYIEKKFLEEDETQRKTSIGYNRLCCMYYSSAICTEDKEVGVSMAPNETLHKSNGTVFVKKLFTEYTKMAEDAKLVGSTMYEVRLISRDTQSVDMHFEKISAKSEEIKNACKITIKNFVSLDKPPPNLFVKPGLNSDMICAKFSTTYIEPLFKIYRGAIRTWIDYDRPYVKGFIQLESDLLFVLKLIKDKVIELQVRKLADPVGGGKSTKKYKPNKYCDPIWSMIKDFKKFVTFYLRDLSEDLPEWPRVVLK